MAEDHIDISSHTSNNIEEYLSIPFYLIITVCDNAKENCPYFPAQAGRFHQNFPDPAPGGSPFGTKAKGSDEEIMNEFRRVRDMIKVYAADFVRQHIKN